MIKKPIGIAIETDFNLWKSGGIKYEREILSALKSFDIEILHYRNADTINKCIFSVKLFQALVKYRPKFIYIDSSYFYLIFPLFFFRKDIALITSYQANISDYDPIILRCLKSIALRLFLHSCKKIIANSEITKAELMDRHHVKPSKIFIFYPEIDVEFVKEREMPSELPVKVMLFCGADKRKGFLTFIQACRYLDLRKFHFYVTIKREDVVRLYGKDVEDELRSLPISFVSKFTKSELIEFYKNIHCVCLPSNYESFGIAALEAIGMKKYTIVSFIFSERIKALVPNKYIFDGSPESLADALSIAGNDVINEDLKYIANLSAGYIGWKTFRNNISEFFQDLI